MADIYQFSQSSQDLLDRCIVAATQPDAKWIELFAPRPDTPENAPSEDAPSENAPSEDFEDNNSVSNSSNNESENAEDIQNSEPLEENLEDIKKIAAILESMPTDKLNYLTEHDNYEQLLPELAGNLTSRCIEIICEDILKSHEDRNESIILHFLPVYIKRESCSTTLNLFISCNKMYPDTILSVTESLFMNIEIPSKQLEELFKAVDVKTRNQFLQAISISTIEVPTKVFLHHLNTISYLHKNCMKTLEIQNFILNGLQRSCVVCKDDKNWGQCLLVFFEGLKEGNLSKVSRQTLEQLLAVHNTTFKKRCQIILRSLYKTE